MKGMNECFLILIFLGVINNRLEKAVAMFKIFIRRAQGFN